MLVLARKPKEGVILKVGEEIIRVCVVEFDQGKVRLGFTASEKVKVLREELVPRNENPADSR